MVVTDGSGTEDDRYTCIMCSHDSNAAGLYVLVIIPHVVLHPVTSHGLD